METRWTAVASGPPISREHIIPPGSPLYISLTTLHLLGLETSGAFLLKVSARRAGMFASIGKAAFRRRRRESAFSGSSMSKARDSVPATAPILRRMASSGEAPTAPHLPRRLGRGEHANVVSLAEARHSELSHSAKRARPCAFRGAGRNADRDLIRSLERRLTQDGPEASRLRAAVSQGIAGEPPKKGGVLAALRRSSLAPTSP